MLQPFLANELFTVIDSRRRSKQAKQGQDADGSSEAMPGSSLFEERGRSGKEKHGKASARPGKLTTAQLRELEAKKEQEAAQSFARVKDLWERMLIGDEEADREWMHEAEMLVESFRETRALFLTTRVSVVPWSCLREEADRRVSDCWLQGNIP